MESEDRAPKENRADYYLLFTHMLEGFAYCKMLFDDKGNPADFVYLDVNPAFEKLTGLKNVVGKLVTEVIPNIKKDNPELFDLYGRVALGGRAEKTEIYIKPLSIWFSLSVYSQKKGYFVAVFHNITEFKEKEMALVARTEELERFNKMMMDREMKIVELKNKIAELEEKLKKS